jgi:hypothetical protein
MIPFLCYFQKDGVNLSPCHKNLTLKPQFLPFKLDTLTTLVEALNAQVIKIHDIVDCQIQT